VDHTVNSLFHRRSQPLEIVVAQPLDTRGKVVGLFDPRLRTAGGFASVMGTLPRAQGVTMDSPPCGAFVLQVLFAMGKHEPA
jgi:hypothetical protein